ncbi:MAG: long-chain fatty acid--CoA ligase [Candidatus Dormibacteria bacterium]
MLRALKSSRPEGAEEGAVTIKATMQDAQLLIRDIVERGRRVYPDGRVVTWLGESARNATFAEVGDRAAQLANALAKLGVKEGERVGTLMWNNQEHLEAYLAVPAMGAVLHTLNLRLPPEQLAFVVNHAEDRVVIVDSSLLPLLAGIGPHLKTVEHCIVVGDGEATLPGRTHRYAELISGEPTAYAWPELDERSAASMCYTTGTTGDPKGVVYSHRSIYLHSMAVWAAFALSPAESLLAIVPMFHVNAWGTPYTAWMVGCSLVLPDRFLQPEPLARLIEIEKPTFAGGVPTVFAGLLQYAESKSVDLSSIRRAICGGSAVPLALMKAYRERHGLELIQAWGMTETSPIGSVALPPPGLSEEESWRHRATAGRVVPGVELRICDDAGAALPWDGEAVGEIEARGPWVTGSYYGADAPEKFHDGWLRTGDVGCIDRQGYVRITDRSKDVIKSGGEWISSVELETLLVGHPAVADATVVGVPDDRWQERPLAVVVFKQGETATPEELRDFLGQKAAKWSLPERWAIVEEIPKTSVGKQDKKVVRRQYADGQLPVTTIERQEVAPG